MVMILLMKMVVPWIRHRTRHGSGVAGVIVAIENVSIMAV